MSNVTKRHLIMVELLILLLLLMVMIYKKNSVHEIGVDVADMITDYPEVMSFDGVNWHVTEESGNNVTGTDYLIYSPDISLKRGTYTLELNYNSSTPQRLVLESQASGDAVFAGDTTIYLSKNNTTVGYDFKLTNSIDDFRIRLIDYNGGAFSVNGVSITRNIHDVRTTLVAWIFLCCVVNLFTFSKKVRDNQKTIFKIMGIAILASLPLFIRGIFVGHDIDFHLVRIEAIAEGLRSGYFPVKMYPTFNDNYGYPVGIYYGDLLLYFPAVLRLIGFSITTSYKLYVLLINICTSTAAYLCGKNMFGKRNSALIFSLAYTLSTYRLTCMYVRAAVGEYTSNLFFLLVIMAVWNIYTKDISDKGYKNNSLLLALGMSGLIYNHVLSTQMVTLTLAAIAIVLFKKTFVKERLLVFIKAVVLTIGLTLAFIVPFLDYYTKVDTELNDSFASTYIQRFGVYISSYFAVFDDVTGGMGVSSNGRMLITPGIVLIVGLALAIYLIIKKKATPEITFLTISSVAFLFVASNIFPWNWIYGIPKLGKFLVQVQFPFRYVGIASCFMSILLCLVLENEHIKDLLSNKQCRYIVGLSLVMMIVFISSIERNEEQFTPYDTANLLLNTNETEFGNGVPEYLLDGTDTESGIFDYAIDGQNVNSAIIQGESGLKMKLLVDVANYAYIDVPRFNYRYYKVLDSDGNEFPISTGENNKIRIEFDKSYSGDIILDFVEPLHWRIAEIVSLLTVIGIVVSVVIRNRKYH